MHGGVFDWRQVNVVSIFAVEQLHFGGLRIHSPCTWHCIRAYFNSFLCEGFPVHSEKLIFVVVALRVGLVFLLINEYFSPERVFSYLELFFWFEECLPWQLFLSLLFASSDDARSFFCHFIDDSFESSYKICPILLGDCTSNLVSSRVVGQVQSHIFEVVRLVFIVELLPKSYH
jgi:hypothetical protein